MRSLRVQPSESLAGDTFDKYICCIEQVRLNPSLNRSGSDPKFAVTVLIVLFMPKARNTKANQLRAGPRRRTRVKKNLPLASSEAGRVWSIPKQLGFPDTLRTDLRYVIPLSQLTGGGTTNSFRYTSNAYDVDSALGSTAMAYFGELALVYSRFRTLSISYHFEIENQEAFPAQTVYGVMTNSLSSTALGANYAENKYMHTNILSAINGSRSVSTYKGTVHISELFGTNQALFDDLFTGSTTASTLSSSATAHCYIGTVAASTPVNGQFVSGWIQLDLLFLRRNSLTS